MSDSFKSIEFSIIANTDNAADSINNLSEALEKLGNTRSKVGDNLKAISESLNGFKYGTALIFEKMGTALKGVTVTKGKVDKVNSFVAALSSLDDSTVERWERLGAAMSFAAYAVSGFKGFSVSGLTSDDAQQAENSPAALAGQETTKENLDETKKSANGVFDALDKVLGVLAMFHKYARFIKPVANALKKVADATILLPVTLGSRFAASIKQFTAGLGQMFNAMKRIALYRLLRTAIKELTQGFAEGQKNLYNYSKLVGTEFAPSMDRLASASLYLKNSLAAMAAPIINAIVPAVRVAVNAIVTLLNYFNMLIAAFTGKSITSVAKEIGTAWDDGTKSAKGANKAAKELKRTILGFDELNVLNDNNNGGGGGGSGSGGAVDFSDMFEEVEIPESLKDFVERVKEMLKAQDWEGLGTFLGEKFNSLINEANFAGLGEKVGTVVGGIISTAYNFFRTADFENVGKKLAEFLNAALSKISTKDLGGLLVRIKTIIPDILIGALGEIKWWQVGEKFGDYFKGVFKEKANWYAEKDWEEIGEQIEGAIMDMINGFDKEGVGDAFWTMVGEGLKAGFHIIEGIFIALMKDLVRGWVTKFYADTNIDLAKMFPKLGKWLADDAEKAGKKTGDAMADGTTKAYNKGVKEAEYEELPVKAEDTASVVAKKVVASYNSALKGLAGGVSKIQPEAANTMPSEVRKTVRNYNVELASQKKNLTTIDPKANNDNSYWKTLMGAIKDKYNLSLGNILSAFAPIDVKAIFSASKVWGMVLGDWNPYVKDKSLEANATVKVSYDGKTLQQYVGNYTRVISLKVDWVKAADEKQRGISNAMGFGGQWPKLRFSAAAKGGIIDAATLFGGNILAGEAGREAIVPLDRNTQWMDDVASRINDNNTDSYDSMYRALSDFYRLYMQSTMNNIASDTRRQADKDENIQITADSITAALTRKGIRDGKMLYA